MLAHVPTPLFEQTLARLGRKGGMIDRGSKKEEELELRRQTIETRTNSSTRYNLTLSAYLNVTSRVNGVNHQIPNVRSARAGVRGGDWPSERTVLLLGCPKIVP